MRLRPKRLSQGNAFQTLIPCAIEHLNELFMISASGARFTWPTIAMSASQPARMAEKTNCTRLPENPRTLTVCDRTYRSAPGRSSRSSSENTCTFQLCRAASWSSAPINARLNVSIPPMPPNALVTNTTILLLPRLAIKRPSPVIEYTTGEESELQNSATKYKTWFIDCQKPQARLQTMLEFAYFHEEEFF